MGPLSPQYRDDVAAAVPVERSRWLGFRWQRHGFAGGLDRDGLEDLLLLGVQTGRPAGAAQSLIQRTAKVGSTSVATAIGPGGPLVGMWSVRGAPHAHRITHLDIARDAFAPQPSDDGGPAFLEDVAEVADALTATVTSPMAKGAASAEVTRRVSPRLVTWCERCQANHVPEELFRAAGRHARLVLGPEDDRLTMLHPTPRKPQEKAGHPRRAVLDAYFRVNGPTGKTIFRAWLAAGSRATADLWRELSGDLVRVQVGDRRYDLPQALLDDVRAAPEPRGVVLVPPHDAYLRQVDRALLVPDGKRRQEVWRALSAPGALLVDGEVAGTWRYRRGDGELTIATFAGLSPGQRKAAARSAELVAAAAGDDVPRVTWT
jgi:hypothetical protein